MAKLIFEMQITEARGTGYFSFAHPITHLAAGSYRGSGLTFDDPGGGQTKGYDNELAAWKTLSLAIQGTRSLQFVMPKDPEIEKFYSRHTDLGDALGFITVAAFNSSRKRSTFQLADAPDQSIAIFDVTVVPGIFTVKGQSSVGMLYSGATKEWFFEASV